MTPALAPGVTLILGGARSGKTSFAENLVLASGLKAVYVATAEARDGEMAERIKRHRIDRGDSWETVEETVNLSGVFAAHGSPHSALLVDCLTLWLSNLLAASHEPEGEFDTLVDALKKTKGPVVLVSNEVGLGIVPDNALARAFRDHAGRLHQKIAAIADQVYFVTAGLPLAMKQE